MLEEIQDMAGEIFDQDWGHPMAECWHDMEWHSDSDADLEAFSLECAFGPND